MALAAVLAAGCAPSAKTRAAGKNGKPAQITLDDALVQFSLVSALAAGDYVGDTPLADLLASGDFGVGTFSHLDGEMIVLDGKIYQALADGTVRAADLNGTTPFAAVTFFSEDGQITIPAANSLEELEEQLDRQLPRHGAPYAIRIDAEFPTLTLRSVRPVYSAREPLVDVVKDQITWEHEQLRGTLVGLRYPGWIDTLNVAGYHWHFVSYDRTIGGHVLACEFERGQVRFDECSTLVIHVPQSKAFEETGAGDVKKQDIEKIERQRTPRARP
jgi:acetolactate decarboxylase